MVKKIILLLFFVQLSCIGVSQSYFQRLLNEGSIYQIYEGINKEYFISGQLASSNNGYLAKLDSNFNVVWAKSLIGVGVGSITKIQNGSYLCIIAGSGTPFPPTSLAKFDGLGNITIIKSYKINTFLGGQLGNIVQVGQNKIVIGGNVFGGGNPNDWMVTSMDTLGSINWSKRYGGYSADDGGHVEVLPNGEIVVTGEPESGNRLSSNQNYGIIKLDSLGNYLWGKDFGSGIGEFGLMSKFTRDNNITYLGYGADSISSLNSALLAKFDLNGNIIWLKKYHFKTDIGVRNFDEDENGNIVVVGAISDTSYGNSIGVGKCLIFSVDKNGNPLWAKSYGDTVFPFDGSSLLTIKIDSRKNTLVGGIKSKRQTSVAYYGYLIKADGLGNTYCKEKNHEFIGVTPNFFYDPFDSLMSVPITTVTTNFSINPINLTFSNYCLPPTLQVSLKNDTICPGNCSILTTSIISGVAPFSFTWTPNIGTGPGPYTVCPTSNMSYSIIIKDKLNQITSNTSHVTITEPTSSLTINPTSGTEPLNITLINSSTNASSYYINFGNNTTNTYIPNYVYKNAGTYTITFVALDKFNCSDTSFYVVTVDKNCEIEKNISNVFTPNGDGINDVLNFKTCEFQNTNCKIFDRWGLLITEINKPNGFWDGYTNSGKECSEGTYFYVLKIKLPQSGEQTITGFVQLFR